MPHGDRDWLRRPPPALHARVDSAARRPSKTIKLYNCVTQETYERERDDSGYVEIYGDELVIG